MLRNYLTFKQIDFIQSEIISSLSVCICLYTCTRKCSIKSWSCLECKKDVFIPHTPLRVWITTQWYRVILQIFFCRIPASSAKILWLYVFVWCLTGNCNELSANSQMIYIHCADLQAFTVPASQPIYFPHWFAHNWCKIKCEK